MKNSTNHISYKKPNKTQLKYQDMLYPNYAQNWFFHKKLLNSVTNLHKLYFSCELLLKITYSAHMGSLKDQKFYEGP